MVYPPRWNAETNYLVKVFSFNSFKEAVNFVNKIVPIAEEMKHHPDIEIFSYKKVKVKLTTHETGQISERDLILAEKISKLFSEKT